VGVGILILAVGFYFWVAMHARSLSEKQPNGSAPDSAVSPKATIAVLPFKNLSGDSETAHFSDEITNDIISDLSRCRRLRVITGSTVFRYKGKNPHIRTIGRELGVRYVLESSVQKTGGTVRIHARLVDVSTGVPIWAERYQRDYRDIFKLREDIAQAVVSRLTGDIRRSDR
jgi:adenylate cyclase